MGISNLSSKGIILKEVTQNQYVLLRTWAGNESNDAKTSLMRFPYSRLTFGHGNKYCDPFIQV